MFESESEGHVREEGEEGSWPRAAGGSVALASGRLAVGWIQPPTCFVWTVERSKNQTITCANGLPAPVEERLECPSVGLPCHLLRQQAPDPCPLQEGLPSAVYSWLCDFPPGV